MKYVTISMICLLSVLFYTARETDGSKLPAYDNTLPYNEDKIRMGVASYYDYVLDSGWSSVGHYVCATRDFVRYSYVEVTNLANGKSVVCLVTDFGPDYAIFPERIIDLSSTSFSAIQDIGRGVIENVQVKQLNIVLDR